MTTKLLEDHAKKFANLDMSDGYVERKLETFVEFAKEKFSLVKQPNTSEAKANVYL
jgi:hypothetical protein